MVTKLPASITRQPLFPVSNSHYFIMPARRRRKRSYKRRSRRRGNKRSRNVRTHSAYAGSLLPNRKNFLFKYCDANVSLAIAGNPIITHSFRANSLFDPDSTGTGHQPIGFDQVKDMYEEFHVIGCRIKATMYEKTVSGTAVLFFIIPSASSGLNSNLQTAADIMEYPAARWVVIRAGDTDGFAPGIPKSLTHQMSVPKFLGKTIGFLASDLDKCTATANPSEQCAFLVGMATMNDGTTAQTGICSVEIEYIAIGHEPKVLLRS